MTFLSASFFFGVLSLKEEVSHAARHLFFFKWPSRAEGPPACVAPASPLSCLIFKVKNQLSNIGAKGRGPLMPRCSCLLKWDPGVLTHGQFPVMILRIGQEQEQRDGVFSSRHADKLAFGGGPHRSGSSRSRSPPLGLGVARNWLASSFHRHFFLIGIKSHIEALSATWWIMIFFFF